LWNLRAADQGREAPHAWRLADNGTRLNPLDQASKIEWTRAAALTSDTHSRFYRFYKRIL